MSNLFVYYPCEFDSALEASLLLYTKSSMSAKALAILRSIILMEDGVTQDKLEEKFTDGSCSLRSGLRELKESGYLYKENQKNPFFGDESWSVNWYISFKPSVLSARELYGSRLDRDPLVLKESTNPYPDFVYNYVPIKKAESEFKEQSFKEKVYGDDYVYFAFRLDKEFFIKIGHSKQPEKRIKVISKKLTYDLQFLTKIRTGDGKTLETEFHRFFWPYHVKQEYFRISTEYVEKYLSSIDALHQKSNVYNYLRSRE